MRAEIKARAMAFRHKHGDSLPFALVEAAMLEGACIAVEHAINDTKRAADDLERRRENNIGRAT